MKGEELSVKAKGMKVGGADAERLDVGQHWALITSLANVRSVKAVGPYKLFEPFPHRWKIQWTK